MYNMYFITHDDYYEIYNIECNIPNLECLICLENKIEYDKEGKISIEFPIQLQVTKYIKTCKCNIWVHNYCLDCWYNLNNNCPICKHIMYQNISIYLCKIIIIYWKFQLLIITRLFCIILFWWSLFSILYCLLLFLTPILPYNYTIDYYDI